MICMKPRKLWPTPTANSTNSTSKTPVWLVRSVNSKLPSRSPKPPAVTLKPVLNVLWLTSNNFVSRWNVVSKRRKKKSRTCARTCNSRLTDWLPLWPMPRPAWRPRSLVWRRSTKPRSPSWRWPSTTWTAPTSKPKRPSRSNPNNSRFCKPLWKTLNGNCNKPWTK